MIPFAEAADRLDTKWFMKIILNVSVYKIHIEIGEIKKKQLFELKFSVVRRKKGIIEITH